MTEHTLVCLEDAVGNLWSPTSHRFEKLILNKKNKIVAKKFYTWLNKLIYPGEWNTTLCVYLCAPSALPHFHWQAFYPPFPARPDVNKISFCQKKVIRSGWKRRGWLLGNRKYTKLRCMGNLFCADENCLSRRLLAGGADQCSMAQHYFCPVFSSAEKIQT